MDDAIRNEQQKLADHLKSLPREELEKQGMGIMCWLQGYQVGYNSASKNGDDEEK